LWKPAGTSESVAGWCSGGCFPLQRTTAVNVLDNCADPKPEFHFGARNVQYTSHRRESGFQAVDYRRAGRSRGYRKKHPARQVVKSGGNEAKKFPPEVSRFRRLAGVL
jgi:hypothetical protein